jgi:RNA polymerase sigma-70 factor (ECF subfamily)
VEGRPLEDTALVDRAKGGDAAAYESLVRRHQETAFRTAYVITGDASEAEDAVQDAFVKAYYALGRFRRGAPFRPWLLRIVANEARNRRSASGRRATLSVRAALDRPSGDAAPSPEAAALAHEQRTALVQAVNGLRPEDRQAIALRYFLDLGEEEMAAALGCARGTVKSRLSRALGRLRRAFVGGPAGAPLASKHVDAAAAAGRARAVSARAGTVGTATDPGAAASHGPADPADKAVRGGATDG